MIHELYDEIITEFYGIDTTRRKIDNVGITRGGRITHWTDKKGYVFYLMTEKDARKNIAKIFGWVELVKVHPRIANDERHKILTDLQAKALEMWPLRDEG